MRVSSFDLIADDIHNVDVHLLHALTIGVGWPHRPGDIELLRELGQGIVATDGIGRVFGSAMWFPLGADFATVGMVITTPRAQARGAGRWLMEQVMARCEGRFLSLNATRPAYPLYVSLGFDTEATVFLRQGTVTGRPDVAPDPALEVLPAADAGALAALDLAAFGVDRSGLLSRLAGEAETAILRRHGRIAGYAMRRRFGRGHVIGPMVAENDADAIQLAAWHIERMQGQPLRIDTREADGPFAELLEGSGLGVADTFTTMSRGRRFLNRRPALPWVYGLAGHALS